MNLTDEQRRAVHYDDGHALLVACPGSGKTRAIVAKLLRCIGAVRGTARRVACITYTNAAVYEIEHRLRAFGTAGDEEYADISTIHAFCLNNVLRHFHWRLPHYARGFSVLPTDCEKYSEIVAAVCKDHRLGGRARDAFELINRSPTGEPIVPEELTGKAILDFWGRLEALGYIDFPNAIYWTYRLMDDYPPIVHALACRFEWMLVDEFQDTSALQVEILSLIAARQKTRFFLVGDPYQSIYGFAGARPELMAKFSHTIATRNDFTLLGNFRSSGPIVRHAELLFPRDPPMRPVGDTMNVTAEPVYIHARNAFEAITDYFLPALEAQGIGLGRSAVLAPWWIKLLSLGRRLRDYGVPIVGPGARPYKRVHLFALLAEQVCAYLESRESRIIPQIERELFTLLLQLSPKNAFQVYTFHGRTTVMKLLRLAELCRENHEGAVPWLEAAAAGTSRLLIESELLSQTSERCLSDSVQDMKADIVKNLGDAESLSITDLGMFARPSESLRLMTLHRAKGHEFDAVALIDLHDGRIPHYQAQTRAQIDEGRRLFYVGITRARKFLMYVTDQDDWRNKPSRFLQALGLVAAR